MSEIQLLSLGYLVFAGLIAGEALWSWRKGDGRYRVGELVVNIGHGAVFQVADGFTKALVLLPFLALTPHAWVQLPLDRAWGWLLGVVAFDFASYWQHRHHHRVHALWAVHGVHHAAEDFNFAAALRQALFGNLTSWLWKAPLALVMPLEMFVGVTVFDYLYQFVQHTQYVPKLGPLEWVLNTPSHHRVHHGRQAQYLDKNYGGIFIVWDRVFGTFEEERAPADFGITAPPNSLNPLWGNLVLWRDLVDATPRAQGLRAKLKLWLGPPDVAEAVAGPMPKRAPAPLENADVATGVLRYAVWTFTGSLGLLGALPWLADAALWLRLALGGLAVLGTLTPAALLEGSRWARPLEGVRLVALSLALAGAWATALPAAVRWSVAAALAFAALGALAARSAPSRAAETDAARLEESPAQRAAGRPAAGPAVSLSS